MILMGNPAEDLAHGLTDAVRTTARHAQRLGPRCAPHCPAVIPLDDLVVALSTPRSR